MAGEGVIVPGSWYTYQPNLGAAVFFAIAFGISTLWHFWQCVRFKYFRVTSLLIVTAATFTVGYALRAKGHYDYTDLNIYIGSTILVYMAPPIIELANFHILGRLLFYAPYCASIHPGRTLTTFGFLQAIVETLNGIGIAWFSNRTLERRFLTVGSALLKASLILQLFVILAFVSLLSSFYYRSRRAGIRSRKLSMPVYTLYASTFFIFVRCVFRTVEIFDVYQSAGESAVEVSVAPLLRYEWYFMVFEAAPMLISMVVWNIFHPGRYLPHLHRIYLARDGVTEIKGPGWSDQRSQWKTFVDPFDLFSRSKSTVPYWEEDGIKPLPGLVKK